MTGYFERLIQQTGIGVQRQSEPQGTSVSGESRSIATQDANSAEAAELLEIIEEVRVTTPQSESSAPDTAASSTAEVTFNPPAVSDMPQSLEITIEDESISTPAHQITQKTEQSTERQAPESTTPRPKIVIQEGPISIQTTVNQDMEERQDKQPSLQVSQEHPILEVAEVEVFQEHPIAKTEPDKRVAEEAVSPGMLNQRSRSSHTRHDYWQVVQEWVAGTPQVDEGVQEVEVDRGRDSFEPSETVIVEELKQSRRVPKIEEHLDAARVENQELVLSIGSIQVTVEEPPPAVQRPVTPAPQLTPRPQPSFESSRLRRHYIRFR